MNLCLESRASQRHRETLQVSARTGKFYFALEGHGMSSLGHPTVLSQEISVMIHSRQEILSEPANRSLAFCLASCFMSGIWWSVIYVMGYNFRKECSESFLIPYPLLNILAGPASHPPRRALLSRPALQNWKYRI